MRMGILVLLLLLWPSPSRSELVETVVRYVSAEHVYLAAGAADGIAVGDLAEVVRDGRVVAALEVRFVADHSASCVLLPPGTLPEAGDEARVAATGTRPHKTRARGPRAGVASRGDRGPASPGPTASSAPPSSRSGPRRLRGSLSAEWWHDDPGQDDGPLDRLSGRLDLRVAGVFGSSATFRARGRVRRYERARSLSTGLPRSEWRERVQVLALESWSRDARTTWRAGRVLAPELGGIGLLDGIQVETRVRGAWRVGGFAGTRPDADDTRPDVDTPKAGAYLHYEALDRRKGLLALTVAAAGEYHDGEPSRELVVITARARAAERLLLLGGGELDLNTGWRADAGGDPVQVSRAHLLARYQANRRLVVGLGYDTATPFRTWETRSVPDSLFLDAWRQGIRADVVWRPAKAWSVSAAGAARTLSSHDETSWSYSGSLRRTELLGGRGHLRLHYAGFSGAFATGGGPELTLGHRLGRHRPGLAVGLFTYRTEGTTTETRRRRWVRLEDTVDLVRGWYARTEVEIEDGDDRSGVSGIVELGVRF